MHRVVGFVVIVVGVFGASLFAYGGLDSDGVYIPYRGHLSRDGSPLSGPFSVRFHIYNQPADAAPCASTSWSSTMVHEGALAADIGPVDPLCVLGQELYLEVELDDENGPVRLSGREQILPATAAVSSSTRDFYVSRNLDVGGSLGGAQSLTAGVIGTSRLRVTGTWSANGTGIVVSNEALASAGAVQIGELHQGSPGLQLSASYSAGSHISGSNAAGNLHIDANSPSGSEGRLHLNWLAGNGVVFGNGAQGSVGEIDAAGNLSLSGSIDAISNRHENCYWSNYTCWWADCANGWFLAGVEQRVNYNCGGPGDGEWGDYRSYCCQL